MLQKIDSLQFDGKYRKEYRENSKKYIEIVSNTLNQTIVNDLNMREEMNRVGLSLRSYKKQLELTQNKGLLTNDLHSIIFSVIHMHCNRLTGNRLYEEKYLEFVRNALYHIVCKINVCEKIEGGILMNYINIDLELKKKIVEKLEKDTENLYQRYKEKKIEEYELSHVMIYIADIWNTSVGHRYQKELEDILGFILRFYREELYEGRYDCFFLRGMYSGIGNIVYALECCIKQGIDVMQFYRYLLKLLMKFTEEYLNQIDGKKVRMNNYDILYGISGLTYYLLDVNESSSDLIYKALRYLVLLTDEKEYRGRSVINFHIEPEQQNSAHETSEFSEGHIDFGMAHGMIGVLVTLAKAKFLGYDFPELTIAIHKLVEIYDKFSVRENGVLKYPTKIGIDEWEKGKSKEYSFNSGWCYGNTGILRGLMKTMKYLEDDVKYSFYQKELLYIINLPISEYKFTTPVLCHGYSSILAMQLNAYVECADIHFLDAINRNISVLLIENERYMKTKEGKEYFQSNDLLVGWSGVDVILNQIIKNTDINT